MSSLLEDPGIKTYLDEQGQLSIRFEKRKYTLKESSYRFELATNLHCYIHWRDHYQEGVKWVRTKTPTYWIWYQPKAQKADA
jgi:hypothetical protein